MHQGTAARSATYWSCPKCGKANPTTEISCLACLHRRPAYRSSTQKQVDLVQGARPPITTTADSRSRALRGSERSRVARARERAAANKAEAWAREDMGDYRAQRELPEEIRLHGTYTAVHRFRDAEERQFNVAVALDAAAARCGREQRQAGDVLGRVSSVSFSPLQIRPGAGAQEFERAAQHAWGPKHADNVSNKKHAGHVSSTDSANSAPGKSALAPQQPEPAEKSALERKQAREPSSQPVSEGASDCERPRLYARRKSAIAEGGEAALAVEKGASEDLRAGVVPALNPGARGGEACCGGMGRGQIPRLLRSTLLLQLGAMRKLLLTHNNLKELPLRVGEMYRPVQELNLAYNQLEQLPSSIALLSRMTTLKLTGNMIKRLPVDMCHHGMQIRKLALESNHLMRLPQTFGRLARLRELRLGYNQITTLPSSFCYLGALQSLDFVANGLMSLAMIPKRRRPPPRCSDGPWDELADPTRPGEVVWVNVRTGEARRAPPNMDAPEESGAAADEDALEWEMRLPRHGETKQITYVNSRTGEHLSRMPAALDQIGRLVSLRVLRLQDNMLSELGDGFTQLTGLRTLNLSGNPLRELPELSSFRLLRRLRARDCQLRKFPHTIGHVTALCNLDLASNFLIELPAAVGLCTNLEALDVSWNALDDLPAGVGFMKKLSVLNTIGNEMGQLLRAMPRASTQKDGGGSGVGLRYVPKTLTIDTVIWCCRQKRLREIRGAPPPSDLRIVKSGLQGERREIEPAAKEAVAKALHDAECCAEARIECRGCRERFGRNRCVFCANCFWKVHEKRRVRLPGRQERSATCDSVDEETSQPEYGHDLVERTYYVGNAVHPDGKAGDDGESGGGDQRVVEEVHDWGTASLIEIDKHDDNYATASKAGEYMRCQRCQQGNGQFSWHWHGLEELPFGLRLRRHLRSIHMTGHFLARENLSALRGLRQLRVLSLGSCDLRQLSPELGLQLPRLRTLSLECNQLEDLPESLCRVTTLVRLTLRGNRLKRLPERLGELFQLRALQLDSNKLETLPDSLPLATSLRILSLSHNRLTQLGGSTDDGTAWDWAKLVSLERLKLDDNALADSAIAPGLERLPRLQDLSLGFNRLSLRGATFDAWGGRHSCFRTSLLSLTLCNNKIRELPVNFQSLAALKDLFFAGNPVISPPLELDIKPMEKKMKYLRLRSERLQEIVRYLRSAKFEVDETALRPVTKNLITGGAGFLVEGDLEALDSTVDRYVNGPFYMFIRDRASAIVSSLSDLRKMRQQDSYKSIVDSTLAVIRAELATRRHGQSTCIWDNELVDPVVRPLGHKGEDVLCYALAHSALFGDPAERSAGTQHRRPPVIDQVRDRVVSSMSLTTGFAGSSGSGSAKLKSRRSSVIRWHDEFCNALSDYEAPFGYGGPQRQVAILNDDDYFPPGAQQPLPALVIVRIVYTIEEAERRRVETTLYDDRQRSLLDRMREWFLEGDGFDVLHKETARRLIFLPERLRFWRQQVKVLTPFVNRSIRSSKAMSKRATQFNRRMVEVLHNFADDIDKDAALEAADIDLQEVGDGYDYARAKMVDAENQIKYTVEMRTDRAMRDIEPKLRDLTANEVVRAGRLKAWRNKLRRPWDGDDGAEYDAWLKKRAMRVEVHLEDTIPGEYVRAEAMKHKEKVVLADDLHPLDEKSQWTWDGVEWL